MDFSGVEKAVDDLKHAALASLEAEKRKFDEYMQLEKRKLEDQRKRFKEECRFMYQQYGAGESGGSATADAQVSTFPAPFKINVGGRFFHTTMTTLRGTHVGEGDSMLAAMFSQRHPNCKDSEGNVFIDRNGDRFAHLLDYLITGTVSYFEGLRNDRRQAQLQPSSTFTSSRSIEYEQILAEAHYFQLRGVLGALLPPVASFGNAASYGLLRSTSNPEVAGSIISWMCQHQARLSNAELYEIEVDGSIKFSQAGVYLVMVHVPGVSSSNNGYAQLKLDNTVVDESWGANANGYHNMLYFNKVLQVASGQRLQLQGVNLTHSFSMGRSLATCFMILPLECTTRCMLKPFVSLRSPTVPTGSGLWSWKHEFGSKELIDVQQGETVTFAEAGTYLIMARVPGCSSSNNGYGQLKLNGNVIGESWSNDSNGHHKTLHFNEVLEVEAGGYLQLQNVNLSHSFNMNRLLATDLTAVRLGGTSEDSGAPEYASYSSHAAAGSQGFWSWSPKRACSTLTDISADGNKIIVKRAGMYLVMARVPGVSSSNNGYAQLLLDGTSVLESWSNCNNGYHRMIYLNSVLKITAGGQLQVQNMNLSHSYTMNRHLATSFTVLLLCGVENE